MKAQKAIPNTRERILAYLRENESATVPELSRAWGLTRADIRYHLHALNRAGLVEQIPRSTALPSPRGRPVQAYRLARQAAPGNYLGLSAALLAASLEGLSEQGQEEMLRKIAGKLSDLPNPQVSLTQRYNQAVHSLNQMAYRARWEAGATGPRILLRRCPYASILDHHPELCHLDQYLLENMLQVPLAQVTRITSTHGGPAACVFISPAKLP